MAAGGDGVSAAQSALRGPARNGRVGSHQTLRRTRYGNLNRHERLPDRARAPRGDLRKQVLSQTRLRNRSTEKPDAFSSSPRLYRDIQAVCIEGRSISSCPVPRGLRALEITLQTFF